MTSRRGWASKRRVTFVPVGQEPPAQEEEKPRRLVSQPNHALLPGAPTFQEYVDNYDRPRNPKTSSYASLDYLRAEYQSAWGA